VEGENLSLIYYSFASSKLQVIGDVSPGPNLPKEKEPPHRGDIGWDRFMLRQFDLQTSSFCPPYKLCNNTSQQKNRQKQTQQNTRKIYLQIYSIVATVRPVDVSCTTVDVNHTATDVSLYVLLCLPEISQVQPV
jgi:hypothetical protein